LAILYLEGEWKKIYWISTVVPQWTPLYHQKKANQDGYNIIAKGCTMTSKDIAHAVITTTEKQTKQKTMKQCLYLINQSNLIKKLKS
jgi:hypothetical protein